jgi:DNA polymerase III subunit epsilon
MKILAVDTETTGTNPGKHSIWQIAGIVYIDGKEKERFEILMQPNPKAAIDPDAFNPSKNKTPEQIQEEIDKLKTYMPFEEGYKTFVGILGKYIDKYDSKDKFFFLAHNAPFDNDFLRGLFLQNGDDYFGSWFWPDVLCTRVLAIRQLMPIRHTMPNFQLMTIARQLGIEIDESKLHDATYDIDITIEVFKRLRLTKTEIDGIFEDFKMQEAIQLAFEQIEGFEAMDEEDRKTDGVENIQIAMNILRKFIKPAVTACLVFFLAFTFNIYQVQAQFKDKQPKSGNYLSWAHKNYGFKGYKLNRGQRKALGLSQGLLGTGLFANRNKNKRNKKSKNQPTTSKK